MSQDNVWEWLLEQSVFQLLLKSRQRIGWRDIVGKLRIHKRENVSCVVFWLHVNFSSSNIHEVCRCQSYVDFMVALGWHYSEAAALSLQAVQSSSSCCCWWWWGMWRQWWWWRGDCLSTDLRVDNTASSQPVRRCFIFNCSSISCRKHDRLLWRLISYHRHHHHHHKSAADRLSSTLLWWSGPSCFCLVQGSSAAVDYTVSQKTTPM